MLRIILFILLMAGVVLLEMYLAHKPGRWPGLVLPDMSAAIAQAVIVWVLANIPTAVLLAIYFAARRRVRRTREQNRMSAQDL